MKFSTYIRVLLFGFTISFLAACGGGSSTQVAADDGERYVEPPKTALTDYLDNIDAAGVNPEDPAILDVARVPEASDPYTAMEKVKAFAADDTVNPPPTIDDFISLGLEVKPDDVAQLAFEVAAAVGDEVDSVAELEKLLEDTENEDPVAYSEDIVLSMNQELVVELDASDAEGNVLTYSIVQQPVNGTVSVTDNNLNYTPKTDYVGNDVLTYKVADGFGESAPSTVNIIIEADEADVESRRSDVAKASALAGKRYIVWFNGTSEAFAENQHLFDGLTNEQYGRFHGLGESPLDGFYRFYRTDASGVAIDHEYGGTTVKQKIDKYITDRLNQDGMKEHIKNADHLMIGGFSRGAAFMLPYFLDNIDTFIPGFNGSNKSLTIFAMDPVHGSERYSNGTFNRSDNTIASLIKLGLEDKRNLVEKLKTKFNNRVNLIYLASGFDMRQKNFGLDTSFADAKYQFHDGQKYRYFTAKMGLTHANMSSWNANGKYSYAKYTTEPSDPSLPFEYLVPGKYWGYNYDRNKAREMASAFRSMDSDRLVTKKIFYAFLGERLNEPQVCGWRYSENGWQQQCSGEKAPGTIGDLASRISRYYDITREYLGSVPSGKKHRVVYPQNPLLYWAGNNNSNLDEHSRLKVLLEGSLESALPDYYPVP